MESSYLSKDNTFCLKGVFAVGVLLHHLYQFSGLLAHTALGYCLQVLGYLSVGMFFFFMGYGLMYSSRKEGYLKTFFRKRFLILYLYYVVLISLYSALFYGLSRFFNLKLFLQSFFWGGTIVTFGWFFQVTFLVYLLYWLCFTFLKTERFQVIAFFLCLLAYSLIGHFAGLRGTLYNSVFCIVLGMLMQLQKGSLDALLAHRAMMIAGGSFILCVFFIQRAYTTSFCILFQNISAILFAIFVIALTFLLQNSCIVKNKVTKFFGKYSLEIYSTQGLLIALRNRHVLHTDSPFVFVIFTIVGTLLASMVLHPVYTRLHAWFK